MASTALASLNVARSQLGYHEGANNDTPYGIWYGLNFAPWCDEFQSWVAAKAGNADVVGKFAYTPSHLAWFKARGEFHTTPAVGDLVFFNWGGRPPGVPEHVGLVEAVASDGSIVTIEGNENNAVVRVRRRSNIIGYGRPAYAAAPKPPAPAPAPHPAPAPRPTPGTVVSLNAVIAAAKTDPSAAQGHQSHPADVRPVEAALKAEGLLPASYAFDGSFGTLTVSAYSAWQKRYSAAHNLHWSGADVNGIPGRTSLAALGARHGFRVA